MIEYCNCEYSTELQKYRIVYKLQGQEPEYVEVTLAQMNDPVKMKSIFRGLVLLHRREYDETV